MVILKFALIRSFRNPIALLASFIVPVALMLFTDLWTEGSGMFANRGYYLIAMLMMFGAFPLTNGMVRERREKTIVRIMSTPTTTFDYLSQNLIACMVPLFLQIVVICTMGAILHDWTAQFTFWIGLLYVIFATASVTFCFAWNCLFKKSEAGYTALAAFLTFATFVLTLPLSIFPSIIRNVFMIMPTYWIASALDELIAYGATMQFGIAVAIMGLFTAIFLLYGSKRGVY